MTERMKKAAAAALAAAVCASLAAGCGKADAAEAPSWLQEALEGSGGQDAGEGPLSADSFSERSGSGSAAGTIYVYVSGAVNAPGVYELLPGARAYEAIAAAGGLRADADEGYVNQAKEVFDGEQISVPAEGEAPELSGEGAGITDGKVNINTAGAEALVTLSGIGESRAADIIAYRESHGPFASIEEIMQVSGIKEALFEKIKDSITVG